MARDKDLLKAIVKEQFFMLGSIIKKAAEVKDKYRKAISDPAIERYSQEYQTEVLEKAKRDYMAANAAVFDAVTPEVDKLLDALNELHGQLDLADPALQTALNTIRTVGKSIDHKNIQNINSFFSGNIPALRILQDAYKSAGVIWDGSLDQQIYDPDQAIGVIRKMADAVFLREGSLNFFAGSVKKIADLEGVEFDGLPDPQGVEEAARVGAGLPPVRVV
jgi:hypothetical protein